MTNSMKQEEESLYHFQRCVSCMPGRKAQFGIGKNCLSESWEVLHCIACGTSKIDWTDIHWTDIHWQLQKAYWIPPWAEGWSTWIVKLLLNPIYVTIF